MLNWLLKLLRRPIKPSSVPSPAKGTLTKPPIVIPAKRSTIAVAGTLAAVLAIAVPFTAQWEGYYGRVYRDSVGVKTICYGQTAADGADFSKVYTEAECRQMLGTDLAKYDADLKRLLKPEVYGALPLHRHAALISFDYNLGAGNLAHIAPLFNKGNWQAGCKAMMAYVRAGGRVLQGLVNRRKAEYALCIRDD